MLDGPMIPTYHRDSKRFNRYGYDTRNTSDATRSAEGCPKFSRSPVKPHELWTRINGINQNIAPGCQCSGYWVHSERKPRSLYVCDFKLRRLFSLALNHQ